MRKWFTRDQWPFLMLVIPVTVFLFAFIYLPMGGLVLAFKNFDVSRGIWGSPWVGFENFRFFLESEYAARATFNTIYLNVLFLITTHLFAVFCALGLNEIHNKFFKVTVQSITYFPAFLSWVVIGVLAMGFFSTERGVINQIIGFAGIDAVNWYGAPELWPGILTALYVWKNAGVLIVIYLAALVTISPEINESARIDGAGLFRRTMKITVPHLMPTMVVMLLIAVGNIFRADSQMMIALIDQRSQLYPTTDVLDFFVYRSLTNSFDVGMPAAVGLYQSVVGFICVLGTNWLARRYQNDGALF